MTRITYGMISDNVQIGIQSNAGKLNTLMTQLATGKALNQPSDDSVGVVKALKLHSQTNRQDQYLRNMQDGISWLSTSETALKSGNDVLQRANELAIQGANDTYSAKERIYLRDEVLALTHQMLSIANTTLKGEFIFSGTQTEVPPYTVETATDAIFAAPNANGTSLAAVPATLQLYDTTLRDSNTATGNPGARNILPGSLSIAGLTEETDYTVEYKTGRVTFLTPAATALAATPGGIQASFGWIRKSELDMTGTVEREVQQDTTVQVNVLPDQAFGSTAEVSVFDSLIDLMQGLHVDDSRQVQASMPEITDSLQRLLQAQTSAGSRSNRLSLTHDQNREDHLALLQQTSLIEDVDFAKTISDFQTRQQVYQASMQVGAKIIQPSLANFL
ncbi:MAG TPA: flagellar hook-associated protein FlgL [Fibrobacteria bacterium]|nr:flagellar hook-associated protein FlgL [Fibrobacteria bacterium]